MQTRRRNAAAPASRRGIVAILVAVSLIVLIGAAAMSLDAGRIMDTRRQVQSTAEAAAMAAAIELYSAEVLHDAGSTTATARTSGFAIAEANGMANDGTDSIVTINIPPKSGRYTNQTGYVEVIVQRNQRRGFSNIWGKEPVAVTARAVAGGTLDYIPGSVLVMDPKKKEALKLKKNGSILEADGAIVVNSKDKKAVKIDKKSQVITDDFIVTGGIDKKGRRNITGDVFTGAEPTADPLASLPPPEPGPSRKLSDYKSSHDGTNTYILEPGTYQGPLKFEKNDVVVMQPGTYTIEDGGLTVKGDATLEGSGVTIYNSPKDPKKSGGKQGIKIETKGNVSLTPPTSGQYKGISIFQDQAARAKIEFKNNSHIDINGTIYAPNAEIKFKKIDADFGGDDVEEDVLDEDLPEEDADETDSADDGLPIEDSGSINAQLIARTISIDKKSHVTIRGTGLNVGRPLLAIVE